MALYPKQRIGILLQTARKKAGLTQSNLGTEVGVRQSTVSRWESGVDMPNIENLADVVKVLNCTYDDLLGSSPVEDENETLLISIFRTLSDIDKSKFIQICQIMANNRSD